LKKSTLIVIVGPTAVGKTSVSIEIANYFNSEIISADSRQLYREMQIGTAVPSQEELEQVNHHFIQSHPLETPISAGQYEKLAISLIENLFKKHDYLVLTGGSGLYVDAVTTGIDTSLPEANVEIREKLETKLKKEGLSSLQEQLKSLDEKYYDQVDLSNSRRVIRALEVCLATGKTYSELRNNQSKERSFDIIYVCLNRDRPELYERINTRVDQMMDQGLLSEVKSLIDKTHLPSLNTVGYSELFDFIDNKTSQHEAIDLIKRNSRRYAKRQITWFKRNDKYTWFHPNEISSIIEHIKSQKNI